MENREEKFYCVFQDGTFTYLKSLEQSKLYPGIVFLLKSELIGSEVYSEAKRTMSYYSYEIINNEKAMVTHPIGSLILIGLSGMDNNANNPNTDYSIPRLDAKIIDANNTIKEIRIVKNTSPLDNLQYLFEVLELVSQAGGFKAFEVLNSGNSIFKFSDTGINLKIDRTKIY